MRLGDFLYGTNSLIKIHNFNFTNKIVIPPTHPFIRMIENTPLPLDRTQRLTKLRKIIPTNYSIIQILEKLN